MVTQRKAPKTSSKEARTHLQRLLNARSEPEFQQLLTEGAWVLGEVLDIELFRRRPRLLVELANLHDQGFQRFRNDYSWSRLFFRGKYEPSAAATLKLRDELRQVWGPELSGAEKEAKLQGWLNWSPPPTGPFGRVGHLPPSPWQPVLKTGRIVPAAFSLHGQVTQAVLEQYGAFGICQNPDCPVRYFLKKRIDQKYCERGECTEYAQRQHALSWWNREGKKARQQKAKRASVKRRKLTR